MIGGADARRRFAWVRAIASAYSSILRGVPELVWKCHRAFSAHLDGGVPINQYLGFGSYRNQPVHRGCFRAVHRFYGAYFTETIRGGNHGDLARSNGGGHGVWYERL